MPSKKKLPKLPKGWKWETTADGDMNIVTADLRTLSGKQLLAAILAFNS